MLVPEQTIGSLNESDIVSAACRIRDDARELRRCLEKDVDACEFAKHIESEAAQIIRKAVVV